EVVVGSGPSGQLDLAVVLVGPEPGHRVVRLALAAGHVGQKGASGVSAHGDSVVPVLHPDQVAVATAGPAGHVAGGDHPGRGPAGVVAHHAVVDGEAGAVEPVGVGSDADADDDE